MKTVTRIFVVILCAALLINFMEPAALCESSKVGVKQLPNIIESSLAEVLDDGMYTVEVTTAFVSEEYIRELNFNSRETNYFGYYLSDVEEQMQGQKWVFSIDEEGETVVRLFEAYDDTYDIALRNFAIGTGVIVICVTVSLVTGGLGVPAASAVFMAAAETGTVTALTSGTICGVVSGTVEAITTGGDMEAALKTAISRGSSAYMSGAIFGAITGGISEFSTIASGTKNGLSMNDVAKLRKETDWSRDTIREISSRKEADLYKGFKEVKLNGRSVLVDPSISADTVVDVADSTVTNYVRMQNGLAPIAADGVKYELHHIAQNPSGVLATIRETVHDASTAVLHSTTKEGVHRILGGTWNMQRKTIWKALAETMKGAA